MSIEVFWQSLVNGLTMGMIYVLIALGLTLLYSIMHIVNFAHGEIYMLGGFVSYYLVTRLEFNYFVSLPITMGILFVVGMILEKLFFSRVRGNFMHCLLVTLGISLIFQSLGWTFFGTEDVNVPSPISGVIKFGSIFIPKQRLLSALIGLFLVGLLYLLISKTKIGRHMRAIEQDSEASELFGVSINLVNMVALGIGFALAAIGGALIGSIFVLNPSIGLIPMLKAFVIIIIGGLGSIGGCILAGLLLGIIDSVVATLLGANLAYVVAFAILILIIIIRPRGFFGHA
ncbi:MAG: branched-chain amino acid ABC transporter permease [candidate division Zixibacteria bacterium]|jgi:branched-chain amino acid transport system permease protein|nr:branched-chain amino acid ABC transporter permease [candidate division Zixibacteria bacterium]